MTPSNWPRPINGGSYIRHPDGSLTLEQDIDAPVAVPVEPAPAFAPEPEVAPPAPARGPKALKEV